MVCHGTQTPVSWWIKTVKLWTGKPKQLALRRWKAQKSWDDNLLWVFHNTPSYFIHCWSKKTLLSAALKIWHCRRTLIFLIVAKKTFCRHTDNIPKLNSVTNDQAGDILTLLLPSLTSPIHFEAYKNNWRDFSLLLKWLTGLLIGYPSQASILLRRVSDRYRVRYTFPL